MSETKRIMAAHVVNDVKEAITGSASRAKLKTALATIDEFILETSGHGNIHYAKTRKALLPLRNTMNGILDSETQKSVSANTAKYTNNMQMYLTNFATELKLAQKSESMKRGLTIGLTDKATDEFDDKSEELKQAFTNQQDVEMLNQFINVLRVLPKKITDGFEIIKAPILPAFNKLVKYDDAFEKAKIKYEKIDFYYILKNQSLIAINSNEHSTRPERLAYIDECLQTINDSGNTYYILVTDVLLRHPNPDNNVMFAWIMERRQFQRIQSIAGSFSVKEWSFPAGRKKK